MAGNSYHGEAIRKMAAMFKPFNTPSYNWLIEKNHRELVEAAEFLMSAKDRNFRWLIDNKYFEMAAFCNAVRGDKKAFQWLMQNKSIFWAATANAVNKDKEAMNWLLSNKLVVYADLAKAIMEFDKSDNSDFSGYYKAPD